MAKEANNDTCKNSQRHEKHFDIHADLTANCSY